MDSANSQGTAASAESESSRESYVFSSPVSEDGLRVHQLVSHCPPLDANSVYCNILQCDHFADTSVKVESNGKLVAFISAYIPPTDPDVLFVWQVAVSAAARGKGLGGRMLQYLLDAPACRQVRYIHTTVTPANEASTAMFSGFARRAGAELHKKNHYDRQRHFGGQHDSEVLFVIGPFR